MAWPFEMPEYERALHEGGYMDRTLTRGQYVIVIGADGVEHDALIKTILTPAQASTHPMIVCLSVDAAGDVTEWAVSHQFDADHGAARWRWSREHPGGLRPIDDSAGTGTL